MRVVTIEDSVEERGQHSVGVLARLHCSSADFRLEVQQFLKLSLSGEGNHGDFDFFQPVNGECPVPVRASW